MSDELPLVSIVTPCYDSVRFIAGCIESVLAQDYPRVEHIVQDGGSRDGTVDVLRSYEERVNWISEPDSGQSEGLNRALQRCRGDVILVLNADDELLPHAVSWGVANLERFPDAAVVYGDQYFIDEGGKIVCEFLGPDPYDFVKLFCVEQVPPAQAAFIRRAHFERVGLYADTTLTTCPDYEMWVRIGMRFPMVHVPGLVARYRLHAGSEGQQAEVIKEMYRSKRQVMDRVLDDPSTPPHIKKLRRRAHAGVAAWTADMLISPGSRPAALYFALKSLLTKPSKMQARLMARYLSWAMPKPMQRWLARCVSGWRARRSAGDE